MGEYIYLYHGSIEEVPIPKAKYNEDHFDQLDFGSGFYTTDDPKVAQLWGRLRSGRSAAIVSRYKFYIEDALRNCSYIDYSEKYDGYRSWFETITQCRIFAEDPAEYQIMFGPISDDNGFSLMSTHIDFDEIENFIFETSYLDIIDTPDDLLVELLEISPGEQIVFKDEEALTYLEYDGVE